MSHYPRPPFAISGPSPSFGIPGAFSGFSRARPAPFGIRVILGLGYVAPSPPHGDLFPRPTFVIRVPSPSFDMPGAFSGFSRARPTPFSILVRPRLGYVAPSPPHGDPFPRLTFVIRGPSPSFGIPRAFSGFSRARLTPFGIRACEKEG